MTTKPYVMKGWELLQFQDLQELVIFVSCRVDLNVKRYEYSIYMCFSWHYTTMLITLYIFFLFFFGEVCRNLWKFIQLFREKLRYVYISYVCMEQVFLTMSSLYLGRNRQWPILLLLISRASPQSVSKYSIIALKISTEVRRSIKTYD